MINHNKMNIFTNYIRFVLTPVKTQRIKIKDKLEIILVWLNECI